MRITLMQLFSMQAIVFAELCAGVAAAIHAAPFEVCEDTTSLLQASIRVLEPVPEVTWAPPAPAPVHASEADLVAGVAIFACLAAYAAMCCAYSAYSAPAMMDGGKTEKAREVIPDSIKFVMIFMIIAFHQQWSGPVEGQEMAQRTSTRGFRMWLAFDYPQAFVMPSFCFISGVFGQKVDSGSLLRVAVYTYGTTVLIFLLYLAHTLLMALLTNKAFQWSLKQTEPDLALAPDTVAFTWYLICLFWWRVTLSPLFNVLRNCSVALRCCVFSFLTVVMYIGYSFFEIQDVPFLRVAPAWRVSLSPSGDYFSLGPYFALGLFLKTEQWVTLLADTKLQVAGGVALFTLYALVWQPTYNEWLHSQQIEHHWPLPFERSRAFHPAFLAQHLAWFAFKGFATFGAVWSIAGLTRLAEGVAPGAANRFLGRGSLSLYAYVLHYIILHTFDQLAPNLFRGLTPGMFILVAYGLAAFIFVILTSSLTEKLFGHIVMPMWLLQATTCCHPEGANNKKRAEDGPKQLAGKNP
eukprot:TRINITY_DN10141_c0_g1_i3.p1 TRINITY_DN10141_c0_g1~~TRINITY_DN10141_c0_g1_i3.p1  ORF type:complete len:522 (+),score=38.24 TRINITY_DN10141_c0_g1_i3:76-1641(+)